MLSYFKNPWVIALLVFVFLLGIKEFFSASFSIPSITRNAGAAKPREKSYSEFQKLEISIFERGKITWDIKAESAQLDFLSQTVAFQKTQAVLPSLNLRFQADDSMLDIGRRVYSLQKNVSGRSPSLGEFRTSQAVFDLPKKELAVNAPFYLKRGPFMLEGNQFFYNFDTKYFQTSDYGRGTP